MNFKCPQNNNRKVQLTLSVGQQMIERPEFLLAVVNPNDPASFDAKQAIIECKARIKILIASSVGKVPDLTEFSHFAENNQMLFFWIDLKSKEDMQDFNRFLFALIRWFLQVESLI